MKLSSSSFQNNGAIPGEFAFGVIDPVNHLALSKNRNPHLAWSEVPGGVKSFALICHDFDVPSEPGDVNQEGKTIPATLPRVDFFHWTLVDLPADAREIAAGEFSDGITPRGKPGPAAPRGTRQGINDYTWWFATDKDMSGDYFGYDGCCPPWNDTIVHHYVFTLYALDYEKCPVSGTFKAPAVLEALRGHVLAQASITGLYSLNPAVKY
jgi:Raf kinase inhibitor-like YbhB/YbcL family protein